MRFLEILTGATALIATASAFRSWEVGQNGRFRPHDHVFRQKSFRTATSKAITSRKPLFNATIPRSSPPNLRPRRLKSPRFQVVENLILAIKSPREVNTWMNGLVANQGVTPTNIFEQFTWRDETEVISLLRSLDAVDAISTFMIHFSRSSSVIVFNTALEAVARSRSSSTTNRRESTSQLLDVMNRRGIRPTSYSFTCLLYSVDGPKAALEIIEKIQSVYDMTIDANVYEAAILACTRPSSDRDNWSYSWETALSFYFRLRQGGKDPSPSTYEALLRACARTRQVRIALTLLEQVKSNSKIKKIPSKLWDAALNVCAQNGRFHEAVRIVRDMQALGSSLVSMHCYRLLLLFSKTGKDKLALEMLDAMTGKSPGLTLMTSGANDSKFDLVIPRLSPNLLMINAAIAACARAGNDKDAFSLFARLQNGEFPDPDIKGEALRPDELSYNSVLSSCKDPSKAKELVKEMRLSRRYRFGAVPPSNITYTYAIASCRKAPLADLDTARFFLKSALDDGVAPDVFMYSAAIWTAEKRGDSAAALQLLEDIKSSSCKPNVVSYNGVISALASTGLYKQAVALFMEMKESKVRPTSMTYQKLAKVIKQSNSSEDSASLLMSVVELMDPSERTGDIGGPIFELLIGVLGSMGRFDDALEAFNMMEGPTGVSCLRSILFQCRAAGPPRWEEAVEILHASDIISSGGGGTGRVDQSALSHAVIACCKANQWEEAVNILELYGRPIESARSQSEQPGSLSVGAMNSAISACGRGGRPDLAMQLFNSMERKFGVRPDSNSYKSIVIVCNQAQHEQSRRERASPSNGRRSDASAFEWWECALSLLRRFNEEGFRPDPNILSSAISACESASQWQRALGILQSSMATSEGTSVLNLYCFNAAISACEKGGAWVEALEIYERMKSIGGLLRPNFVTLNSLLVALDKAGQKELAQSMYEEGEMMRVVQPWVMTRDSFGNSIRAMDMHKLSAPTAKAALRSWLESIATGQQKHRPDDDLVIIVGKGLGSEDNKPVLMPALQDHLKQEYGICGVVDDENPGRLVVKAEVLRKFVSARRW